MKRVLVIGDAIADIYREFRYRKQCPDAPNVPVGVEDRTAAEIRPGGAANVAVNLAALTPEDVSIDLIALIDHDIAKSIKRTIGSSRINLGKSFYAFSEQALRKERIVCPHPDGDFTVRLDNRTRIDLVESRIILDCVRSYLNLCEEQGYLPDLVIISDYDGGVLTPKLLNVLEPLKDRLLVDTKMSDLSSFDGSLLAKLNSQEYESALLRDHSPERFFKYFVVTHGRHGARLMIHKALGSSQSYTTTVDIPAIKTKEVDSCGCGDTFLAGLAAGLLRYNDPFEAVSFANAAAATVVEQKRTAVADLKRTLELTGRKI